MGLSLVVDNETYEIPGARTPLYEAAEWLHRNMFGRVEAWFETRSRARTAEWLAKFDVEVAR